MDLEGIMLKWNKSDREERQILYDFIYMWNLKKKNNKWTNMTKQKHGYKYREQTGDCQKGGAGWNEWNKWWQLRDKNFQLQNK